MHRVRLFLSFFLILGFTSLSAQTSWEDYQFSDTFQMGAGTFKSTSTVFTDISDSGVIVGYYTTFSNTRAGLVYFKNGKTLVCSHPGYTHTEFWGINKTGQLIGRAYTSPSTAVAITGNVVNEQLTDMAASNWRGDGSANVFPYKINNDGVASGTVQSGVNRWLNLESVGSSSIQNTDIYVRKSTKYNTFGTGINDYNNVVGYIIDGAERRPFLYQHSTKQFDTLNFAINLPGPRTQLTDINNDNWVALEYRDTNGFFQGTIGKLNFGTKKISYNYDFPYKGPRGSVINAINNNGDIVGSYTMDNGETYAFFATISPMQIPDFNYNTRHIYYDNTTSNFGTDSTENNYFTGDPYKQTNDSMYKDIVAYNLAKKQYFPYVASGTQSPPWPSFVLAQGESDCYIGSRRRLGEVSKWLSLSDSFFSGYCSGISIMTGQHFADTNVVYNRFTKIPHNSHLSDYLGNDFNEEFRNCLGALQLYQNSSHMDKYYYDWDAHVDYVYANKSDTIFNDLRGYVKEIAQDFYDKDRDSLDVFGIYLQFPNQGPGGHDVFPIKLSRAFDKNFEVDTLQLMDPNFHLSDVDIYINYKTKKAFGHVDGVETYKVWCGTISGSIADFNMAQEARLSQNRRKYPKSNHMKANKVGTTIVTNGLCEYEIRNQDQASEKIEVNASGISNTFPGVYRRMMFNSDSLPDSWISPNKLKTEAILTGCDEGLRWEYQYENGNMIYERSTSNSGDQDIVLNDENKMTIKNTSMDDRQIAFTSIYSDDNEEALVRLEDFTLKGESELFIEAGNMYRIEVDNNDGESTDYNLKVRYLADNEFFEWLTTEIPIGKSHHHTILLRPTDEDKEVRILIDTTGDGMPDDSLEIENGGKLGINSGLISKYAFSVYPNPASKQITIEANGLRGQNSTVRLIDVQGRIVLEKLLQHSSVLESELNLEQIAKGSYLMEFRTNNGYTVIHKKLVVH